MGKIVSDGMYLGKSGVGEVIIECGGMKLCCLLENSPAVPSVKIHSTEVCFLRVIVFMSGRDTR